MAYGDGDTSFQAAGGEAGLRRLVDDFYDIMASRPAAATIRAMHPDDLDVSRDKLARFLCGWLGGPHRYNEKYGRITIPGAHTHLDIGAAERDAWMGCMREAIDRQPWEPAFKDYLARALAVPAERVRLVCERVRALPAGDEPAA
ncbi:MAG: group II truncated hemoglobin [Gammaproteobacteria bacterium]